MIRVALHVVAGTRGGPRTYGVALAHALRQRDDLHLVVLTDRPGTFEGMETVRLKGPRPFADHVAVPRILKRLRPDVYHNTKNALPLRTSCPSVVTIHDLAYHHFPETFGAVSRRYLRFHHEQAARRADRIIVPSHHAKSDLTRTLGVRGQRIEVIHHGVARVFRRPPPPLGLDLDHPYVLSIGTIQARKNLDVLVDAVAILRERRNEKIALAIAGRRGWKARAFDEACRRTPVTLLGVVPDAMLPALYAEAAVFVQPSSYEGFGLTAAEAMCAGVPVVAADAGSLPEVVGDAGMLVPPRDARALADALGQLFAYPALASELGRAGLRRAEQFTWERSAEQHLRVYRKTARKRRKAKA